MDSTPNNSLLSSESAQQTNALLQANSIEVANSLLISTPPQTAYNAGTE